MCKLLIARKKKLCQHTIDEIPIKIPFPDNCGKACEQVENVWLGSTTDIDPCDDCVHEGKYVKDTDGRWKRAAEHE